MKRLFIAIKPYFTSQTLMEFEAMKNTLQQEHIKWVNFNQLHLTLKFLGDTEERKIPQIITVLNDISKKKKSFQLCFRGVGVFKNFKIPRVFWVGIEKNDNLEKLHLSIERGLSIIGFKQEIRSFSPHLTLGRIKSITDRKNLIGLTNKNANKLFQSVNISVFYLMQSVLNKTGPVHTTIEMFTLQ